MSGWKGFFAAGTVALAVSMAAPVVASGPAQAASGGQLTEICVNSLTGAVVGTNGSVACNLLNQVDYTVAATGATGAVGATGPQGNQGIQGIAGAVGATGPQGNQGIQGVAGAVGATGPAGAQGIQGVAGAVGPAGAAGPIGPQGPPGLPGLQGPQGLNGLPGATGLQGLQGIPGPTGPIGLPGLPGITGATGPQGIQGIPGLPGGPPGPTGPTGPGGGGLSSLKRVSGSAIKMSSKVPGAKSQLVKATCPSGYKALGGGAVLSGTGGTDGAIHDSYPDSNGRAWDIKAIVLFAGSGPLKITPFVRCGK
jgi:hypothetical protein